MNPTANPTAALCAIMKNEAQYILEWVAFHRLIGFDEILVYDNDSADNTPQLLSSLASGQIVRSIAWPSVDDVAPQRAAYADALRRVESEWICFIDADEFINLKQDDSIQAFLGRFPESASAIAMNWRVFGSSGHVAFDPDFVIRRFTGCSPRQARVNRHCKTIARRRDIQEMHIHRCFLKRGLYVDEGGQPVEVENWGLTPKPRTELVQVNHYVVKSREEYEGKQRRGNANRALGAADKFRRLDQSFFTAHDVNQENDVSIQRFDSQLVDEVAFLRKLIHAELPSPSSSNL